MTLVVFDIGVDDLAVCWPIAVNVHLNIRRWNRFIETVLLLIGTWRLWLLILEWMIQIFLTNCGKLSTLHVHLKIRRWNRFIETVLLLIGTWRLWLIVLEWPILIAVFFKTFAVMCTWMSGDEVGLILHTLYLIGVWRQWLIIIFY